ncbi:hypothetical protein PORY_002583 [Pneumocystis oryctolagi]|uniref:Uncharacterized protein n=1 Tax=Pneumocystis oryctolagi TaxID=42067 RepID=A0ACB7CAL0_9ASCO|nr:hypothetical protein PORY_002583 [Pneumocystis oryctolagi]
MDVVQAIQNYIESIATISKNMKILLLDAATVSFLKNSEERTLLSIRLDNTQRENVRHLTCICVLQPCLDSVQQLSNELKAPRYGRYFVYFTNILSKPYLEMLAASDDYEVVHAVQEVFADYLAVHSDLAILYLTKSLWNGQWDLWNTEALQQTKDGILSILLSLKRRPVIRYEKNSKMAWMLAKALRTEIEAEAPLFDFYHADTAPILLLLDRCNDPVTPLLTPWTYEAMVHELVGIVHGRVKVSNFVHEKALQEMILSPIQDTFFKENMYLNFGDLGIRIKEYVEHYRTKTQSNIEIQNVSDMKRFVEEYPEFRQLSDNVAKHVTLISELSTRVNKDCLLDVSELEQSLACDDSHAANLKDLQKLIQSPITNSNKVKLVLLYALRYEKHPNNALSSLLQQLEHAGVSSEEFSVVNTLLEYAGSTKRLDNLFESESFFFRTKNEFKELNGVENVYTQHKPRLQHILMSLIKGRLREQTHPYIEEAIVLKEKPQDIIVYMIGGTTYTEAKVIHEINLYATGVRIVLAGDQIHNSSSFLQYTMLSLTPCRRIFVAHSKEVKRLIYTSKCLFESKHTTKDSELFKYPSDFYGPFALESSESAARLSELPPNVRAAYLEPLRRPAKYGIITCSLQMRSFEMHPLVFFADFSMRVAYYLGLSASGPVPLPKRIERWTVPRGPFAHSKSKENFERITYKRLITIRDGHPRVVDIWLAYLAKHIMKGVGMKAHVFRYEAIKPEKEKSKEAPRRKQ